MSPEETPQTQPTPEPTTPTPQQSPESAPTPQPTSPFKSKGIIIAAIIVIVAVVIGVSALLGFGSASQYQGYIKKVEQQTADLQEEAQEEVLQDEGVVR